MRSHGRATIEEASEQLWRIRPVLSLESFRSLYFPDGRVRPKFRKELLDRGVTPQQIAWLEDEAEEEMQDGGAGRNGGAMG